MQGLVLAALVAVATAAATAASKSDVVDALEHHGKHPHATTLAQLNQLAADNGAQNEKLAKLENVQQEVHAIRARIDMLLLREIDKAQRSPRRRARIESVAAKVRDDARKRGEVADPLAGLEGL